MTTQLKVTRRVALGAIAATVALALAMGGGSADAGSKVGAKKLKAIEVRSTTTTVNGTLGNASVDCLPGERALSVTATDNATTGLIQFVPSVDVAVNASLTPASNPTGAIATMNNQTGGPRRLILSVTCLHK